MSTRLSVFLLDKIQDMLTAELNGAANHPLSDTLNELEQCRIQLSQYAADDIDNNCNFTQLANLVIKWADEKGILFVASAESQALKFFSEAGELADAVAKDDLEELIDAVGDVLVTLILLCRIKQINPVRCLDTAYGVIKNRTGRMVGGVFVKDA